MVEGISNSMTVLGLANGMIGGTILVLPIIGLTTGYISSLPVCLLMGAVSCYTAYLIVLHLGKAQTLIQCVLAHFNQDYRYVVVYSGLMWFSFLPIFIIYFRLICLQVEGLMQYSSPLIGPAVAVFLVLEILVVQKYHIGEQTLAYGIISIVTYILFLVWAQLTAPEGPKEVPATGNVFHLISALEMAFSIQNFAAQAILRNPNRQDYTKIIVQTFLIGVLTYTFIVYGSYAIVNRDSYKATPETIEDFFTRGGWQITLIQLLYLVHLISAYPEFMMISKVRFFEMFSMEFKQSQVKWQEVVYIVCLVGLSFAVFSSGIYVEVMISVNGAVLGFIFFLVVPIFMHFKCVLYDRSSGFIEDDGEHNVLICPNSCQCDCRYRSRWTLYLQVFCLVLFLVLGTVMMVATLGSIGGETASA